MTVETTIEKRVTYRVHERLEEPIETQMRSGRKQQWTAVVATAAAPLGETKPYVMLTWYGRNLKADGTLGAPLRSSYPSSDPLIREVASRLRAEIHEAAERMAQ